MAEKNRPRPRVNASPRKRKTGNRTISQPGKNAVAQHNDQENAKGYDKIDTSGAKGRKGNGQAREIDLGDEIGISDDAVGGTGQAGGEKSPGHDAAEGKENIGLAAAGEVGHLAENQGVDQGLGDGFCQSPGDAKEGLFVQGHNVTPGQKTDEFPVLPEFFQVEGNPAFGGFDEDGCFLQLEC